MCGRYLRSAALMSCLLLAGSLLLPAVSQAKTAQEIDASVNAAISEEGHHPRVPRRRCAYEV